MGALEGSPYLETGQFESSVPWSPAELSGVFKRPEGQGELQVDTGRIQWTNKTFEASSYNMAKLMLTANVFFQSSC